MDCQSLLADSSSLFTCKDKVDIVVLLDGSGSLGWYGWLKSREFASNFIKSLWGGAANVQVSLQLFSGPRTWWDYWVCTGWVWWLQPNLETQCNIKWIKHFNSDTEDTAKMAANLGWPAASTLTSVALAEAEAELIHGREDASTVVVVITDGWPISHMRTRDAANSLKRKARLVWVPVGWYAPLDMIHELASLPKEDHIIHIPNFWALGEAQYANKVLANACQDLEVPQAR